MRAYLDAMDAAPFDAVPPVSKSLRVLAALGPKMLQLAAERADGAHPYFVPPEHTARAREILGADRILAVEQAVVLETDSLKARGIARTYMAWYLTMANYLLACAPRVSLKRMSRTGGAIGWSTPSSPGATWALSSIGFALISRQGQIMFASKC